MRLTRRDLLKGAAVLVGAPGCKPAIVEEACGPASTASASAMKPLELPSELAKLPRSVCELRSYDELASSVATVYSPRNGKELGLLLRSIDKRAVTVRGAGHSFDKQSLGNDVVVSLLDANAEFARVGDVEEDEHGYFVTAGAAATWWKILEKVAPLGLVPRSFPTAGRATIGGTLSADCLSRMSPITGKEGENVRSLDLVLSDGRQRTLRRETTDAEERSLFEAVIGGFGYLGVVTSVTIDLSAVRRCPNSTGANPTVATRATRHGSNVDWDRLLRRLHTKTTNARRSFEATKGRPANELGAEPVWSAVAIASFFAGNGICANLLEQRYSEEQDLRRAPGGTFDKDSKVVSTGENMFSWMPTLTELGVQIGFPDGDYVDELFGWAFFLGNACDKAKEQAHAEGHRLNVTQQTWLLPVGDLDAIDTRPTRRFIELLEARLHRAGLRPLEVDVLFIPADRFLMSASRDLPSFAVTTAIVQRDQREREGELSDVLMELTRDCRLLGGRVHLVKNVVADPSDLRAMHGDAARSLRRMRAEYDPKGLFQNEFFARVFGA